MELPFAVAEEEEEQQQQGGGGGTKNPTANLLHNKVALYDNVIHTEHFFTPHEEEQEIEEEEEEEEEEQGDRKHHHQHHPHASSAAAAAAASSSSSDHYHYLTPLQHNTILAESTFVTVRPCDATSYNKNNTSSTVNTVSTTAAAAKIDGTNNFTTSSINNNNHNINEDYYEHYTTPTSSSSGAGGGVEDFVSIGFNSYRDNNNYYLYHHHHHHHNNQNQHHIQDYTNSSNQKSFDVLSLLISSCSDTDCNESNNNDDNDMPSLSSSSRESKMDYKESTSTNIISSTSNNNNNANFVRTCKEASQSASKASQLTQKGDIPNAIIQHIHSAKRFKEAATYLKTIDSYDHYHNYHNGDGGGFGMMTDLALLAYSLLVLSNAQSKTANALIKCSGGGDVVNSSGGAGSGTGTGSIAGGMNIGSSNNISGAYGTDHNSCNNASSTNRRPGDEEKDSSNGKIGLRAKIRASMNKAEADMTESTFLNKGSGSDGNVVGSGGHTSNSSFDTPPPSNSIAIPNRALSTATTSDTTSTATTSTKNNINPVDDMMELEKELRDMDKTLEMGMGLTSSSSANNNYGTNSIYVVPNINGSSYMSSSMMWSSGIGGRAQQQPQQPSSQQQQQLSQQQRPRGANRVQHISAQGNASQQTIIAPAPPKYQQQQPTATSLEASWWGQASALASSTTSLSNSMVGVRSPNHTQHHPFHGSMDNNTSASSAPANTKQLMRLLDSLKTLGEENASLMREVEDAQKARLEAKAARETMKQFKEEYSKRFATLKAALEKFRSEYPDNARGGGNGGHNNTSGGGSQNIVTKSDFVKTNTMLEMQKRDQLIKKLTNDLKKEKSESKKKDEALRKYENFYREVKARSAQKAKQREEEQRRKMMQR